MFMWTYTTNVQLLNWTCTDVPHEMLSCSSLVTLSINYLALLNADLNELNDFKSIQLLNLNAYALL